MDAIYEHCALHALDHHLFKNLEPFAYWHVCESIQEGYSPEAVGCFQETAEMEAWIQEERHDVRDHALGLFLSRLKLARATDEKIATAISTCAEQLGPVQPIAFDGYILNTKRIYEYIDKEKENCGLLDGYPDWHWIEGVQTITQWTHEFRTALDLTTTAYTDACKKLQPLFEQDTKADLAFVKLLSQADLSQLTSRFAIAPKKLTKPLSSQTENAWDEKKLVMSGKLMRQATFDLMASTDSHPDGSKDSIVYNAINAESSPDVLFGQAEKILQTDKQDEAVLRAAKQRLTSALQILAERDGGRNIDLRIVSLNNRASINFQLASCKKTTLKYYQRALADWKASLALDQMQTEIVNKVQSTENLIKELEDKVQVPKEAVKPTQEHKSSSEPAPPADATQESHVAAPTAKLREKTILESPFFRADLVSGLLVDTILSPNFPHRAFRDTLRLPDSADNFDCDTTLKTMANRHHEIIQSLTNDNHAQVKAAAPAVAAVLALPMLQTSSENDAVTVLRATSLRLVSGCLSLLQNNFVKAQTEFDLVSNALRPTKPGKPTAAPRENESQKTDLDLTGMQTTVQGHTLLLLAKTCWLQHKSQEASKYHRWYTKWHENATSSGKIVPELDMRWWDHFVVKKIEA